MTTPPLNTLLHDIARAGGRLVLAHDRITLTARTPLPSELVRRVRKQKSALLRWLSPPPVNQPGPCPHLRTFTRAEGSHLCIDCWHALAPGANVWAAEAAPRYCADEQHVPYPDNSSMSGIMQCQHCPEVWRDASPLASATPGGPTGVHPPGAVGGAQCPWCDGRAIHVRGDAYTCRTCRKAW